MRQKSGPSKAPAETVVKNIRRLTRKQHSAEEKIRIVPPSWSLPETAGRARPPSCGASGGGGDVEADEHGPDPRSTERGDASGRHAGGPDPRRTNGEGRPGYDVDANDGSADGRSPARGRTAPSSAPAMSGGRRRHHRG